MDWWDNTVEAKAIIKHRSAIVEARPGHHHEAMARLELLGARSLTDAELVGLVTGAPEAAAGELVQSGLKALLAEAPEQLAEHNALKRGGALKLLAAVELTRRLALGDDPRPKLATPNAIYEYARPRLAGLRREEFHVLCVNTRNVLLRHVRVAEGSIDQCHVDPREALAPAVACRATGIVLVHNHPSGDPQPSVHDLTLTRQLRDGARLLCIRLLDHVVLGDNGFVSMVSRGLLGDDGGFMPSRLQSP